MAKKKQTKVEVEESQFQEEVVVETPQVVKQPKREEPTSLKTDDGWELKQRTYLLRGQGKPLSYIIKSADIYWFDEIKGYERELKYCSNQKTCFVDEMKGQQRLEHIIFRAGILNVPKEKVILQKLLSLYHPHKNKLFREFKPVEQAETQLDRLEFETDALIAAKNLDIDIVEAVMRERLVLRFLV